MMKMEKHVATVQKTKTVTVPHQIQMHGDIIILMMLLIGFIGIKTKTLTEI